MTMAYRQTLYTTYSTQLEAIPADKKEGWKIAPLSPAEPERPEKLPLALGLCLSLQ